MSTSTTTTTTSGIAPECADYQHHYQFREFDEVPGHNGVYECDKIHVDTDNATSLNLPQSLLARLPELRAEYDSSGLID